MGSMPGRVIDIGTLVFPYQCDCWYQQMSQRQHQRLSIARLETQPHTYSVRRCPKLWHGSCLKCGWVVSKHGFKASRLVKSEGPKGYVLSTVEIEHHKRMLLLSYTNIY
jgi:hypothetical protein